MTEAVAARKAVKIRPVYIVVVVAVLVVVAAGWLIGGALRPYVFHGTLFQSPTPALNFTLTGHNGQAVSLDDYKGKVVMLYFGYTTCPDVCPTTLAELHTALQTLGNRAKDVQVIMVTVDPERDTVPVLAEYMPHFDASFIGLTGTPEQIAEIATYYGVAYERSTEESALGYLVNHTATVATLDRKGYVRVIFPFQTPARDIAADVEYLLNR
ncbi:MAG: SCO family protein [Chloroflexi bacterium]|nr:SCO family protein [Chloroflexota bacterium]